MESYEDMALIERLTALPDGIEIALVERGAGEDIRVRRDLAADVWRAPKDEGSFAGRVLTTEEVVSTSSALDAEVIIPDWRDRTLPD